MTRMTYQHFAKLFLTIALLFTACSTKTTHITITNNITAFTVGDYELAQVGRALSTALATPLLQYKEETNQSKKMDLLTLRKEKNDLALTLHGDIFQKGQARPETNIINLIEHIADTLKRYPHIVIQLTGNTDNDEQSQDFQELSDNRAITIAEIFYTKDSNNEIFAKGCNHNKELVKATPKDNRFSNAPIHIYLYANKEKMLDPCK